MSLAVLLVLTWRIGSKPLKVWRLGIVLNEKVAQEKGYEIATPLKASTDTYPDRDPL